MKAIFMIFKFRLAALFDVLFSERFELQTWKQNGRKGTKTTFWRQEILDNIK